MIKLDFYEVGDYYSGDGRGPYTVIARFDKYSDATTYARGRGNYGANATVGLTHLVIYDNLDEAVGHQEELIKSRALEKLTAEEKRVLGLNNVE